MTNPRVDSLYTSSNLNSGQDELVRVWLVDDDVNFCQFLSDTLSQDKSFDVLGFSLNLTSAKQHLAEHKPDLVTVDMNLPDGSGVELIAWLSRYMPNTKKMVVSLWGQDDLVIEAFKQGADGYLQKDKLIGMEISGAIHSLADSGMPVSPKIAKRLLSMFEVITPSPSHSNPKNQSVHMFEKNQGVDLVSPILNEGDSTYGLSEREVDVLKLLAKGLSYQEIADNLCLSIHTVSTHIKHIYRKINVNSRGEAVFEAQQNHIV